MKALESNNQGRGGIQPTPPLYKCRVNMVLCSHSFKWFDMVWFGSVWFGCLPLVQFGVDKDNKSKKDKNDNKDNKNNNDNKNNKDNEYNKTIKKIKRIGIIRTTKWTFFRV